MFQWFKKRECPGCTFMKAENKWLKILVDRLLVKTGTAPVEKEEITPEDIINKDEKVKEGVEEYGS